METTTQEKNILIAKFLGWKENTDPTERFFGDWFNGFNRMTNGNKEPLLFHCNWNWLMPVVQKIEQLPNSYDTEEFLLIRDELATARIETTYSAVIDFINYYNTK